MTRPYWSAEASRRIVKRIVVEGTLVLITPAHLGSGTGDGVTDMPLLVDARDGRSPVLTGASLAGALRSYLHERECGYGASAQVSSASVRLLGGRHGMDDDDELGEQSPLIVEDARGETIGVERRDGVALARESRTADNKAKFDLELWPAGTTFDLRFELLIRDGNDEKKLRTALASALEGFNDGHITLGGRKRRGFGSVEVSAWRIREFDLATAAGLRDWLLEGGDALTVSAIAAADLAQTLAPRAEPIADKRSFFEMKATFELSNGRESGGSLLIRSGGSAGSEGPDMVHLHAQQKDKTLQPVLSGTSLAGALRARAEKIVNTLDREKTSALIRHIFGTTDGASPLAVWEEVIQNGQTQLVQNRVSIDRFTGGAREGFLFNQQPVFGRTETRVTIRWRLRLDHEDVVSEAADSDVKIGLLLHLLKDLWTGDLPLGGESSVGRGRLQGEKAVLKLRLAAASHAQVQTWTLTAADSAAGLSFEGQTQNGAAVALLTADQARTSLGQFGTAFWDYVQPAQPEIDNAEGN